MGLGGAALLLIVIVSLVAGSGGGDSTGGGTGTSPVAAAAGGSGYMATFSSLCGKSPADMNLEMAGSYEFSGGTLPAGVTLEGNAWLDSEFGVKVDGEGDGIALGPTSAEGWSGDDDFTISFAFTKSHCRIPGECKYSVARSSPQCDYR